MTTNTSATILLIETSEGDTVGVRFPSMESARDWEDEHIAELTVRGCVRVVSKTEALREVK